MGAVVSTVTMVPPTMAVTGLAFGTICALKAVICVQGPSGGSVGRSACASAGSSSSANTKVWYCLCMSRPVTTVV